MENPIIKMYGPLICCVTVAVLICCFFAISDFSVSNQVSKSRQFDLLTKVELVDDSADGMLAGRSAIRVGTVRANNLQGFDIRSVRIMGERINKCLPKWLPSFIDTYRPSLLRVEKCIMTDQQVADLVQQSCINNVHFHGCILLAGDPPKTIDFAAKGSITFVDCQFITSAEICARHVHDITIMSSELADAQLNQLIETAYALTRFYSDTAISDLAFAAICRKKDLLSLNVTGQDLGAITANQPRFRAIRLEFLALRDCTTESSICNVLKQLRRLDYVVLEGRSATNETVQALLSSSETLRSLLVSGEAIDDRIFAVAAKMPALKTLMIRETNVSKAALLEFSKGFNGRVIGGDVE